MSQWNLIIDVALCENCSNCVLAAKDELVGNTFPGYSAPHGSLEGYVALRVVVEALGACTREPDRACLLQVLGSRSFDLPGVKVQFGRAQRQQRPFVEINMLDAQGRLRH